MTKSILLLASVFAVVTVIAPASANNHTYNHTDRSYYDLITDRNHNGLTDQQMQDIHFYMRNEFHQPCQNYLPLPTGLKTNCYQHKMQSEHYYKKTITTTTRESNVLNRYEVNFDLDSSLVDPPAFIVLNTVSDEIMTYKPREVLISGHTDTSGSARYNMELSKNRARAVSAELTKMGVPNRVLDQEAWGESSPAVATGDGVMLRENRRVIVEFVK